MLAKLLGFIDLFGAISIVMLFFGAGQGFAVLMAILIILKSLAFITAFASWIDFISGVIMLIAVYFGTSVFLFVVLLWLLQKFFFSLFSE